LYELLTLADPSIKKKYNPEGLSNPIVECLLLSLFKLSNSMKLNNYFDKQPLKMKKKAVISIKLHVP